jgi:hypothetical protein
MLKLPITSCGRQTRRSSEPARSSSPLSRRGSGEVVRERRHPHAVRADGCREPERGNIPDLSRHALTVARSGRCSRSRCASSSQVARGRNDPGSLPTPRGRAPRVTPDRPGPSRPPPRHPRHRHRSDFRQTETQRQPPLLTGRLCICDERVQGRAAPARDFRKSAKRDAQRGTLSDFLVAAS